MDYTLFTEPIARIARNPNRTLGFLLPLIIFFPTQSNATAYRYSALQLVLAKKIVTYYQLDIAKWAARSILNFLVTDKALRCGSLKISVHDGIRYGVEIIATSLVYGCKKVPSALACCAGTDLLYNLIFKPYAPRYSYWGFYELLSSSFCAAFYEWFAKGAIGCVITAGVDSLCDDEQDEDSATFSDEDFLRSGKEKEKKM